MMKILYKGKAYTPFVRDGKLFILVGKKELFAGYGEGNMNMGFEIVE